MSNVKLAIRVRPFTERELRSDKEQTPVVNIVDENIVTITNVKVSLSGAGDSRARVRRYAVDYAFDSACSASMPSYASQEKMYDTIGREVVDRVSRGCSACVLAYGQSATGKTYTMMGTEEQPGLVPRICMALAADKPFDITVSFLEIYNERVHDLLAGECAPAPPTCHSLPRRRGNARKDLRVREHPARGTYVQNLRRVAIHSVEALLSLVQEGAKRRRTAATKRNSTSSRSHALLELSTQTATLHLADLAGSEKADWEGCRGGRQKEGANINKSLVALSNVISALVSGGSGRGRFVPYRDSALTWLLKDCFTGGASTFIIATVSPSVSCYGESASTLRWAARARHLQLTCAGAARAPATRAALQAQYDLLLAELTRNFIRYVPETGKITYDDNHWKIFSGNISGIDTVNKTVNIGNIMNRLNPKADAQSESTASSVASGSSDMINTIDKNTKIDLNKEISKQVDKLFAPALERTQSNSDLKMIAPLRHKRRQYKSQEVLPIEKKLNSIPSNAINVLPSHSEAQINSLTNVQTPKNTQIPILYDNQRAEIVASVTERLYNKIKKKEEAAASKFETVSDKKIVEPLNELRICTNARQQLVDLSQKSLKNRRRIGIPAYTQTRKMVTRVRDQCIDTQTDLESYFYDDKQKYSLRRDASTETMLLTPRCKEIGVGSKYGILTFNDRSTVTDEKKIIHKNSCMMTDVVRTYDKFTQTQVLPPPRRKRSHCCKCTRESEKPTILDDKSASIVSINIGKAYALDSESHSSEYNSDNQGENVKNSAPPDLITNHNSADVQSSCGDSTDSSTLYNNEPSDLNVTHTSKSLPFEDKSSDFSDVEEICLPRVTADSTKKTDAADIKDIILGRNENLYPYNIILSPPRDRGPTKIIVKFSDVDIPNVAPAAGNCYKKHNDTEYNIQAEFKNTSDQRAIDNDAQTYSSTMSSKSDSNSFIWKNGSIDESKNAGFTNSAGRSFTPVYKSKQTKYAKAKAKLYREFLGLDTDEEGNCSGSNASVLNSSQNTSSLDSSDSHDICYGSFRQKRNFLEQKLSLKYRHRHDFRCFEQDLINSCNSLESSIDKYENYLERNENSSKNSGRVSSTRKTPTEYLQHLVQIRREVVKGEYDTNSYMNYQK